MPLAGVNVAKIFLKKNLAADSSQHKGYGACLSKSALDVERPRAWNDKSPNGFRVCGSDQAGFRFCFS